MIKYMTEMECNSWSSLLCYAYCLCKSDWPGMAKRNYNNEHVAPMASASISKQ
jgi:hypothetical protein